VKNVPELYTFRAALRSPSTSVILTEHERPRACRRGGECECETVSSAMSDLGCSLENAI
jgi:hypothetical protein